VPVATFQTPPPDFAAEVRPLLADRCFRCHGPDESAREAGLRLDVRAGAQAVLVAPEGERSPLVARLVAREMPPADSGLELSDAERARLVAWAEAGAPWAEHWAFRTLEPPELPSDDEHGWCRDPLDRFVLARLAAAGLEPAPEADRERWLRRVSFDLAGLPPSAEELGRFRADPAPDAYEEVVDGLLGSVQHAEHLAAGWLDLARYADTYGYQADVTRAVWPWRDWVVRAFHENLSFDRFATWQLAGDLLPGATRDQHLATCFDRLHRQTNEGGSVEEEFRTEYVADRVQTFGTAFLGLTLECARCHDHKFDPISQREFYGLAALFANIDESGLYSHFTNAVPTPALDLATPEQEARRAALEARLRSAEQAERRRADEVRDLAALDPLAPTPGELARYPMDEETGALLLEARERAQPGTAHGEVARVAGRRGGGLRLSGDDPLTFPGVGAFRRWDPFSLALWVRVVEPSERAVLVHRSRAWHDAGSRGWQVLLEHGRPSFSLAHFWPGDALSIRAREPLPAGRWVHLAATYDGSSRAAGARLFVDGREVAVEVVRDGLTRAIVGGGEGDVTVGERFRDRGFRAGEVDDLVLFGRELAPLEVLRVCDEEAWSAFFARRSTWSAPERAAAEEVLRARARDATGELLALRRELGQLVDGVEQIMVMRESAEPRACYRLSRGRYDQRAERVEPGVPAALDPTGSPSAVHDRLDLARWLFGPARGLVARVAANRLWSVAFGQGLVATPEDFGVQGAPPSHPELLEYLAGELIASGWDQRALLRRLVLSATYRQDSRGALGDESIVRPVPRRLSAEAIRDAALQASGLLVGTVGGPPAKPYQPEGIWEEVSGQSYVPDGGEGLWRRSLYTIWKRTAPPPAMLVFDAAPREVCAARRPLTTTPLQALALWNDVQLVEAARGVGERAAARAQGDRGGLTFAVRSLLGRTPEAAELDVLERLLDDLRARFTAEPDSARQLCSVGTRPVPPGIDPVELASWTMVATTLFGHDGFVTLR